jgi:hypothetical protein
VLGRLFGYNRTETTETDIILTLTPRIVRVLNLTAEDLQPFRVPRDGTPGGMEMMPPLPIPLPLPKPPGNDDAPLTPGLAPAFPPPPGTATPLQPPKPVKPPKF